MNIRNYLLKILKNKDNNAALLQIDDTDTILDKSGMADLEKFLILKNTPNGTKQNSVVSTVQNCKTTVFFYQPFTN